MKALIAPLALLCAMTGCVVSPLQDADVAVDNVVHVGGYASKPEATVEISMFNVDDNEWEVVQSVQASANGTTIAGDTLYRFDTDVDIDAIGGEAYGATVSDGVRYQLRAVEDEVQTLMTFDEAGIDCVLANMSMGWLAAGNECYHADSPVISIVDRLFGPANEWWHAAFADVPANLSGSSVAVGQTAPNVTWTDQNGDEVDLYQLYGHVVVVKISAGWCPPCQDSAPHGEALWAEYQDDGLEFVTVMLQGFENNVLSTDADLDAWVDTYGITHPVVHNPTPSWMAVPGYPTYVVIDRDMTVVYAAPGSLDDSIPLGLL